MELERESMVWNEKKGLVWNLDEKTSDCMDWNESQKYGTGVGMRPTWILVI